MDEKTSDGSWCIDFQTSVEPMVSILRLDDDGKIFWKGREVLTDEDLVNGLRELLQARAHIPITPTFAECRRYMANTLKCDKGLFIAYQANVAMLLHDRYGIEDYETRNKAAAEILELIFEVRP